ncbi:BspA family leucine-rich repeat surface protein, partial [Planktomarina temperata]|nr:BspA family leucine-rich repeat surface protein [Planktomarina temperata]
SGWDTSKVTDMGTMFFGASTFNQDLSRWNITNVVDMAAMFSGARAFNQDISKWVTSKLTNMSFMFEGASAFNQDLSGWNTSKVTDMAGMFKNAVAFDQEIRGWDVSKVGRFTNMFDGATAFAATYGTVPGFGATPTAAFFTPSSDATLSALTLSQGSLSPSFVSSRAAYNAGVIHATSSITVTPTVNDPGATVTVNGAPAATPVNLAVGVNAISVVVTAQDGVTTQTYTVTVHRATATSTGRFLSDGLSQVIPIPDNATFWAARTACLNESAVTGRCQNYGDTSGYGDMENWDTSLVTDMSSAFNNNVSFNGDISGWDTSNVTNMGLMFWGASAFNQDLSRWNTTNVKDMAGMFQRALVFNQDLSRWKTTNVTNMVAMFNDAGAFNHDISKWQTSNVTNMAGMFDGASAFNQDLSGWNTSKVTRIDSMFKNAVAFDQEIRGWDVSKVGSFTNMFDGATAFAATYGTVPGFGATPTAAFFTPPASSDATLSALSLSSGSLSPGFASGTLAYTASVAHSVSSLIVTPTTNDANATATVNGASPATPVTLSVGSNTVTVQVTAQDGTTQSYTVAVTRAASSDATLSALTLSQGNLSPSFASGTLAYTSSVPNSVSSLIVTPTTNDANATATVNGASAATPVTLAVGSNTVTVQVTAQDGTTTQNYTVTVTRAAALTVALTGPSGTVTGPFTVTATLSSQVVSFVASDVTVVNGQVTGVTGSGTSYAIAVKPVLGQQVFVSVAAGVVSTALGTSNQLSNILQVQAGSPATALAAHEDELAAVIRGEAGRELRAGLAADQRMVRAGFQRFMARRQSNAQGVNGFVPFDITGTARYRNGSFRTNGDFFALSTVGGKQWHRVAFGDFDFLSYSLGNSSGYLTARLAYETQFSQDVMLGYYIGADIGKAKVGGTFNGTQNSVGLSFGGYFNRIYNDKLIVSGFASLGQRQHDFDASNTTLAVSSDYRTATGRVGGSVTGFIERGNITIAPELAFNVARTNVHSIPISGTAYGLTNNNLSLDVGGVDLASISFTPHVKLRVADHVMPGYRSSFSIGPKISCEAVRASSLSKDCGTGVVLGMTMISNDGATVFQAELQQEGIGGTKRRSVKLSFQHQF